MDEMKPADETLDTTSTDATPEEKVDTGSTVKGALGGAASVAAIVAALAYAGISTDKVVINDGTIFSMKTISASAIEARPTDVAAIHPGSAAAKMIVLADTSLRQHARDSLLSVAYRQDSVAQAQHTPVMQQGPVNIPIYQLPAGHTAVLMLVDHDETGAVPDSVVRSAKCTPVPPAGMITNVVSGMSFGSDQPARQ